MTLESGSPVVTTGSHPRRPPAHLSVSLKHDVPSVEDEKPAPCVALAKLDTADQDGTSTSPLMKQTSDDSEDTVGTNVNEWFDRSNTRPVIAINRDESGESSDPPYFLQQSSNDDTDSSKELPTRSKRYNLHPLNAISRSRDGSASEEYRSIIDDLTIENKKLKERLNRYGRSSVAHLENEKLFEVKIHSLSARKRRELEELLRSFSTSFDSSSEDLSIKAPANRQSRPYTFSGKTSKQKSISSGSNSRPTDSAYASMSRSGPSYSSAGEGHPTAPSRDAADKKMQDFLQDIPQGLLPRTSLEMSENQRRRMVVRRLEQLFTGKKGSLIGVHSHSLQQQEVSRSAARADQVSQSKFQPKEGVREAHIGPHNMELDRQGLVSTQKNSKTSQSPTEQSTSPQKSRGSPSPEQRPTRPLDLDPDRDQVGSDNVEYIRHLGISAPQLLTEESQDAAVDADGWVYLNLLINMAQLHIINVTPDFIRSAVTELSKKLQVSPDGKKLRWRGGTEGTHLSSDSGGSSVHHRSPLDSDGSDEASRKRRKVHANKFTLTGKAPSKTLNENTKGSVATGAFYYEPMFVHYPQRTSVASGDESILSQNHYNLPGFASPYQIFGSNSPRDDGPLIFYNGAKFFTDLSGDRDDLEAPLHITGVDKDGYSSHTRNAIGCSHPERHLLKNRTPSGSLLPFRPFKDYSKGVDLFQTPETRPQTPSVLSDDVDFEFTTDLACGSPGSPSSPVDFSASGLGGVQPADHLLFKVHTRWTIDDHAPVKVSKFSAPRSTSRKIVHTIPKSSLDSFHNPEPQDKVDSILDKLNRLTTFSNEPATPLPSQSHESLPVKTENISEELVILQPSTLPAPSSYYSMFSGTETTGEYSDSSSFSGIAHLRDEPLEKDDDLMSDNDIQVSSDDGAMDVDDAEEDDDDESIDMLAYVRGIDPTGVAAQEEKYEWEASDKSVQLGSAASKSVNPVMFSEASEVEL
ncbi:hypothetical protein SS1G_11844 [Sclerotinia sclerotiorum 1980 UF-70]|uniref:Frequency clock protein n=1 Tax=Sclerotinia sclerotiorum (strain ATCC 18683 / 1980 / Ss-1) TaxID=665079 RepID=A7F3J8_SCLS1|nr:hypothetical protein SS1G_11844 [Sclerotinia sclerotiorum 1980 UF-70]EDN97319.1 hypothetical protein SS1G_11844 [Sclerotinia sclerotiorum 1980 UF-70]